jgi:DHA3 family macrolide efflux protein-like MFS transporter
MTWTDVGGVGEDPGVHESPAVPPEQVVDPPGDLPIDDGRADEADPRWRRNTAVFLGGQTISLFGSMIVQYAVMWHLTLVTKSGVVLAISTLVGFVPQAIVSVFGGVWADRHHRKVLVIASDATIAVTTAVLAVTMLAGHDDLWLIYVALAIRSAGAGVQTPAVAALLPQVVPASKLIRVNGINASLQSGLMLLAPAVAAAVYASFDIVVVFMIDVVTAVIGIGFLLAVPVARIVRSGAERVGYVDDLLAGARYVRGHGFVRWLLGLSAAVFVLAAAPSYLTPLMIVRTFGDEVWKLTASEVSFSVGMLLGGVVLAAWAPRQRAALLVGSTLGFGVLSVGLGLSTNMWVFFALMWSIGLVLPAFSTPTTTVLQEAVELPMQGRVFGFQSIVMAVAMPLGMAVFGPLADRVSVQSLLVTAGVALFAVVGAMAALPGGRRALAEIRAHEAAVPAR